MSSSQLLITPDLLGLRCVSSLLAATLAALIWCCRELRGLTCGEGRWTAIPVPDPWFVVSARGRLLPRTGLACVPIAVGPSVPDPPVRWIAARPARFIPTSNNCRRQPQSQQVALGMESIDIGRNGYLTCPDLQGS